MEAQLQRQQHHHYEEDLQHAGLHSVIEGEGETEHHEKKSVLKKVKEKAKKIKNTLTKHGHEHEHEHGHEHEYRHDQMSEEEEDDEDEEMVNDPEVHGAPIYESSVITGTKLPMQTGVNLEKPTDIREDRFDPNTRNEMFPNVHDEGITRPKTWPELGRLPDEAREPENKNNPLGGPYERERGVDVGESRVKIGPLSGLEEDPHSPKNTPREMPISNYQSKVTDPMNEGGKEAEVAPLIQALDNLKVHDEPKSKPEPEPKSYTGSHDQFAAQPTPTEAQFNPEPNPLGPSEPSDLGPKMFDQNNPESMPTDTIAGKISSATSAIANKAVSAKNVVVSKLGYTGQSHEKPSPESTTDSGHIVAGAVSGGGDAAAKGAERGVSMKEYIAERFRPGDEDKALSEAITDVFHKKKEAVSKGTEDKPAVGRVTESEEVKARLGTGFENKREGEDAFTAGIESSSGAGVVDRLREAVGSWLGKSNGMETAQQAIGQSYVSGAGSAAGAGGHEESKKEKK